MTYLAADVDFTFSFLFKFDFSTLFISEPMITTMTMAKMNMQQQQRHQRHASSLSSTMTWKTTLMTVMALVLTMRSTAGVVEAFTGPHAKCSDSTPAPLTRTFELAAASSPSSRALFMSLSDNDNDNTGRLKNLGFTDDEIRRSTSKSREVDDRQQRQVRVDLVEGEAVDAPVVGNPESAPKQNDQVHHYSNLSITSLTPFPPYPPSSHQISILSHLLQSDLG
jgi:hypothetical protein